MSTDLDEPVLAPATWRVWTALVLSLAGLAISSYLTYAHFAGTQALSCPDTGVINCAKVTTSAQSRFLGIPVAMLGLGFYLVFTGFNVPWAWWSPRRWVHIVRLVMALSGILFVLWLISAELLIIGNICLWCTAVHVVTFLLFVLVLTTVPPMLGWGARED